MIWVSCHLGMLEVHHNRCHLSSKGRKKVRNTEIHPCPVISTVNQKRNRRGESVGVTRRVVCALYTPVKGCDLMMMNLVIYCVRVNVENIS